jgi:SAM-dependent methyltransferase
MMNGRVKLITLRTVQILFKVAGILLASASVVWLVARLMAPHGMTGLEMAAVFLATALMGPALVGFGSRRIRRHTHRRTLQTLIGGYRNTALVHVAAKLGLADLLADGPRSSAELARTLGAHAPSLHRILRGLVILRVCSEERDGRFGLTALGAMLRTETPGSPRGQAILCGEEYAGAWVGLPHSAMTGETAFDHVFGMSPWEHRKQHPELDEYFNAGLRRATDRAAVAILAACDFSSFHTVADIGGGHGALLAAILRARPSISGILFDQPHVVAEALPHLEAAGVAARCRIVGGSFFDGMPDGADAHILRSIIHDWDDEHSLAILRNCHRALGEPGRLLLVERVMPDRAEDAPDTIMVDVHMLAVTGGRERSEAEHRALLAAAGFTPTRVIPIRSGFVIIEAIRAET